MNILASIIIIQDKLSHQQKDKYKVSSINRLASISCFLRPFSSACTNLDPRSVMRGKGYFLIQKQKQNIWAIAKLQKQLWSCPYLMTVVIADKQRGKRCVWNSLFRMLLSNQWSVSNVLCLYQLKAQVLPINERKICNFVYTR